MFSHFLPVRSDPDTPARAHPAMAGGGEAAAKRCTALKKTLRRTSSFMSAKCIHIAQPRCAGGGVLRVTAASRQRQPCVHAALANACP
jgi:hypothetical protein